MFITVVRPAPQRRFHAARPAEHDRSTQPLCRCNVDAPTMNSQNIGPAVDSSIAPAHRPSPSVVSRAAKKTTQGLARALQTADDRQIKATPQRGRPCAYRRTRLHARSCAQSVYLRGWPALPFQFPGASIGSALSVDRCAPPETDKRLAASSVHARVHVSNARACTCTITFCKTKKRNTYAHVQAHGRVHARTHASALACKRGHARAHATARAPCDNARGTRWLETPGNFMLM